MRTSPTQLVDALSRLPATSWVFSASRLSEGRPVQWVPIADLHPKGLLVGLNDEGIWTLRTGQDEVVEFSGSAPLTFLLPCLEQPFPHELELIRKGLKDVGLGEEFCALFPFQDLVSYSLTEGTEYWAGLAITWLEQKLPINQRVGTALHEATRAARFSQNLRHRARRLIKQ